MLILYVILIITHFRIMSSVSIVIRALANGTTRGPCYNASQSTNTFHGFVLEILTKFYIHGKKRGVRTGILSRCTFFVSPWIL